MMPSTWRPARVVRARQRVVSIEPGDKLQDDGIAVAICFAFDAGDGL